MLGFAYGSPSACLQPPFSQARCSRRTAIAAAVVSVGARLLPADAAASAERVANPGTQDKVITTPSGLRWYDFSVGSGEQEVADGDVVRFHLVTGTTGARNGWKIASTYDGDALVYRVGAGEVVPGLEEALRGMHVGGRRRALVPPELGYSGKGGKGQAPVPTDFAAYQRFKNIYLNSARPFIPDVVFDIELLKISRR